MKPVILVIEDETALVTLIRYNLEAEGFEVLDAPDGEEGLLILSENAVDLILLDWMLPNLSGIEICRQIRRRSDIRNIPVIMLTARGEEGDRVRGLNAGADDYLSKPFSYKELIARIHAILRRIRPALEEKTLTFHDMEMNVVTHRVTRDSRSIHLGPTEYRLLCHLMENPGRVFTRDQLINAVWGHDVDVDERTVDVHIRRLRQELNAKDEVDVIRTVRGAGYALDLTG